jgi:transposase
MSSLTLFVGLDVAKDTLDVAVRPTAETWQVANEAAGISALVTQLAPMAPALVVLEATGGCEGPWLAA